MPDFAPSSPVPIIIVWALSLVLILGALVTTIRARRFLEKMGKAQNEINELTNQRLLLLERDKERSSQ